MSLDGFQQFMPPTLLANMRPRLPDGISWSSLTLFEQWIFHPTELSYDEWLIAKTLPPPGPPNRIVIGGMR